MKLLQRLRTHVDSRDLMCTVGVLTLAYGGECLLPGLGFFVAGGVVVAIAVFVR